MLLIANFLQLCPLFSTRVSPAKIPAARYLAIKFLPYSNKVAMGKGLVVREKGEQRKELIFYNSGEPERCGGCREMAGWGWGQNPKDWRLR